MLWTSAERPSETTALQNHLHDNGLLDDITQAVILEFFVYNANVDLYTIVIVVFEFTSVECEQALRLA